MAGSWQLCWRPPRLAWGRCQRWNRALPLLLSHLMRLCGPMPVVRVLSAVLPMTFSARPMTLGPAWAGLGTLYPILCWPCLPPWNLFHWIMPRKAWLMHLCRPLLLCRGNLDAHYPHWFTLAAKSGWRSHHLLSLVGGPSGPCLWFRGNFLVLRHWTPWTVQLRLLERGNSWQGFTDVIASQSAPGRLRVLHGGPQGLLLLPLSPRGWYQGRDRSRDLLQIGETGLETKLGRGPFIPFEPRSLADVLPGLRRAGGPADDALGPAVGYFSPGQLSFWAAHTPDLWVLSTLSRGYRLQFRRRPPIPGRVRMTAICDPVKAQALNQEICTLLAKGAIVPVDPLLDPGGFYSMYFLVPKKTGGLRPVLDLRGLNVYLKVMPFHMLTTKEVLQAISPGDWFTSVDLRDAYFHIPIAPPHWRFLRFAFQGRHFQFRVLPFGLSLSPRVFTRCVAAALSPLQAQGLRILPYLDDWLICAATQDQAVRDTRLVLHHVRCLGLQVNMEKSALTPSQETVFLGIAMDSISMAACPSPQRVDSILSMLPEFGRGMAPPLVRYLRLLGMLTAASAVVPLGLLSLRPLQMWLNSLNLDPARYTHRLRRLRVGPQCLQSLSQWRVRLFMTTGVPLGSLPCRREVVFTDASSTGWGATWRGQMAQGTWSRRLSREHINVLELQAVFLALQSFLPGLQGKHVLVRSDNTTVVFHINHQGGTRSRKLLCLTRRLLTWAAPCIASLRAAYIPGPENVPADFLSRRKPLPGEWKLHQEVVERIWTVFGRAAVDLFASRDAFHCPLWFSLDNTSPLGRDALAHDWPRALLYAFPPFGLLFQTLLRVRQEGHRVLLVAPYWPARTWFPLLCELSSGSPMRLPSRRDLLSQVGGQILHPEPDRLQLWIWPLQGRGPPSQDTLGP
ncbi:uncharacterized protein LOC116709131 [Xiphophorus hellerii]|uniref:uncharacterized protein LOC116709131 n=1 Tax=Xiphophorus hellerii TaxID=8084 RepID=UPI0013B362AD|nr:uncharacterized protein LOC116709131 [Xiphophorus hellerii]